jgi:predicted Zn-dependent peptidase
VVVAASGAFDRSTLSAAFTALPSVHAAPIESTHSAPSERAAAAGVYVVDEPGRTQTVITAGHILAPNAAASLVRARLAVGILGSRVYDDLRTQHQWAYEAQAALSWSDDAAPAIVIATEVVTDHAADAVAEIRRECGRPAAAAELGRLAIFRRDLVQQIVGGADSVAGVTAVLADLSRRGLPATAAGDLLQDAANLDEARVADALRLLNGDALTFVLAGDAQTLMPRLKAAGIGGILVSR